jgi:hypothetical protein
LQLRDEERNKEIPKPDYSPMQIRKSGQFIKKVLNLNKYRNTFFTDVLVSPSDKSTKNEFP